jgi:hypothetical protein
VVVLTSAVLTCPALTYYARKNDVQGIGYARTDDEELFDRDPDRALQGIAFLNDLPYWLDNPDEFETTFLHEIGHRWLARVHAEVDGTDVDLLGRQGGHWSYFLDSSGSPLEGNVWSDDETPIADTPAFPRHYSPLDLYLMGAIAADDVPPFRLLQPTSTSAVDCRDDPVGPASPPQTCGPIPLPGAWLPLSIEDVIAKEGDRVPNFAAAQTRFSVAFLLLDAADVAFDRQQCQALSEMVSRSAALFAEATDGRLHLDNVVRSTATCDDLPSPEPQPSGCQLASRPPKTCVSLPFASAVVLVGLGFWLRGRRRGPGRG